MKKVLAYGLTGTYFLITPALYAAGYQLWEQDGASIGNYHAGYAAAATDASTAFYNPAGMAVLKNQQWTLGGAAISSHLKYRGSVTVIESPFAKTFNQVSANGGNLGFIPALHFVNPINKQFQLGLSINVPFGLKTDYGRDTAVKYLATRTLISVINLSPALGYRVSEQLSLGAGFDIQQLDAEFNNVGTLLASPRLTDTDAHSKASSTGYGYHAGGLYQFNSATRIGLSYHSQVVHHLYGSSTFDGPLANLLNHQPINTQQTKANITLPPYTALGAYYRFNPQFAFMGNVIYTQWQSFKNLAIQNIAGAIALPPPILIGPSNSIQVVIPEHYRNSWNISVGGDWQIQDHLMVRAGIGYDQTPVRNAYRNLQLPDNDRYVVALGGHYQLTKIVGIDLGGSHLFFKKASVNPPAQVTGGQAVITQGKVRGSADVYGAQMTLEIS